MNPPRSSSNAQLNYFQQSPVRGQLETPVGDYALSGWRYLQCTDTPNEMRVLLPPRTAQLYAQLLRAEIAELGKDRNASWDRIVHIRHLKDRMIRKCLRLVRETVPKESQAARVLFHTVHAPPDFRLKEMERWFRDTATAPPRAEGASPPYCCSKCRPPTSQGGSHLLPTPRRGQSTARPRPVQDRTPSRPVGSVGSGGIPRGRTPSPHKRPATKLHPSQTTRTPGRGLPPVARESERALRMRPSTIDPKKFSSATRVEAHPTHAHARSPEPLPIPFRPRQPEVASPIIIESSPDEAEPPSTSPSPPKDRSPPPPANGHLPTIHEGPDGTPGTAQRPLPRRRSSLKKSMSMSRLSVGSQSKSVAWAMDRDWTEQMSRYTKASNEAEVLGHELEALRAEYHAGLELMKDLCRDVSAASERVRQEVEVLQHSEEAVRKQETQILSHGEQIEQKEAEFQAKVLTVLEETKRVVQLCDKKRDMHDD